MHASHTYVPDNSDIYVVHYQQQQLEDTFPLIHPFHYILVLWLLSSKFL